MIQVIQKNKTILLYGSILAILLFLMRAFEFEFLIMTHAQDVYTGFIAVLFTALGVWIASMLFRAKTKTIIIEKEVHPEERIVPDENALKELALSKREMEVLGLMAKGLSNAEIAEELFVSLNTIKTHSSRIFEKLDVKRRSQAVEKARNLSLVH